MVYNKIDKIKEKIEGKNLSMKWKILIKGKKNTL